MVQAPGGHRTGHRPSEIGTPYEPQPLPGSSRRFDQRHPERDGIQPGKAARFLFTPDPGEGFCLSICRFAEHRNNINLCLGLNKTFSGTTFYSRGGEELDDRGSANEASPRQRQPAGPAMGWGSSAPSRGLLAATDGALPPINRKKPFFLPLPGEILSICPPLLPLPLPSEA